MILSYHGLFDLNKENKSLLNSYSSIYNHVLHSAFSLIAKSNLNSSLNYFSSKYPSYIVNNNLNYDLLINDFLNHNLKLPSLSFDLSSEDKKYLLSSKQITSRQLNSIRFQLKATVSSIYSLTLDNIEKKKLYISSLKNELIIIKNKIKSHQDLYKLSNSQLKNIYNAYPFFLSYILKKKKFNTSIYLANIKNNTHTHNFHINNKDYNKLTTNMYDRLLPIIHMKIKLEKRINKLTQELRNKVKNLLKGKLSLCFGTNKLFNQQFNLKDYHKNYISKIDKNGEINPKSNHDIYFKKWKRKWLDTRNQSFYLLGAKAETAGNQSCQGFIQDNGLITLKIRCPDKIINTSNVSSKYIVLEDLNFGCDHEKLKQALKINLENKDIKDKNRECIHYNFSKIINSKSPKHNSWKITFQLEQKPIPLISDKNKGAIGIDLNQEHISVSNINKDGNLLNAFDIPMKLNIIYKDKDLNNKNKNLNNEYSSKHRRNHNKITDLSSNQSKNLIEHIVKEICVYAKKEAKPIVIEELDFRSKKVSLAMERNNNEYRKKRNKQLSMFVYSKFKSSLLSRAEKEGIEIIEVNPAYTSVLGLAKYQKIRGISSHQAASYVIGRRGLGYKENIPKKEIKIEYKGTVLEIAVPERNQNISSIKNKVNVKVQRVRNTENSLLKDLSKKLVKAKSEYRKKLKQANILRIKEDKEKSISSPDIFISGVT